MLASWSLLAFCLMRHGGDAFIIRFGDPNHRHLETCDQIRSPEKRVEDYFSTNGYYYFPSTYKETVCKQTAHSNAYPTCAGGMYHCITKYQVKEFLKIPENDPTNTGKWDYVSIKVAIGCECLT